MDVPCSKCGEPWDFDTINEEVTERFGEWDPEAEPSSSYDRRHGIRGATVITDLRPYEELFNEVRADFTKRGCVALGGDPCIKDGNSVIREEIYGLMGEDIDGAACFLEDFNL